MRRIILLALGFAFASLAQPNETCGQIQLGEHLNNPSPPEIVAIGQSPLVYQPVREDSPVLYFTPFFVFENTPEGKLKVLISEPLSQGSPWRVRLTLLISPSWLVDSLATEVRGWAAQQADLKYKKYSNVDRRNFIPTEFTSISITQEDGNEFRTVFRNDITPQQPLPIEAEVTTKEAAQAMKTKLETGRSLPVFHITYRLFARMTVSDSHVKVSGISVSQTDAVLSLKGAGRAFRMNISPPKGEASVGADETYMTRDQFASFAASVRNEISADYVVEDPADLVTLQTELDQYFKRLLNVDRDIPFDVVGKEMAKISAYNFSPRDLSPARIQNIAIDAKNYLETGDQEKSSFNTSGSASFLGFGGSGSLGISREVLKKNMEDKGWKFDVGVNAFVPISLNVKVLNKTTLDNPYSLNISVSQRRRQIINLGDTVTTAQGFSDKSVENGYKELTGRNLRQDITALRGDLDKVDSSRASTQNFTVPFDQGATQAFYFFKYLDDPGGQPVGSLAESTILGVNSIYTSHRIKGKDDYLLIHVILNSPASGPAPAVGVNVLTPKRVLYGPPIKATGPNIP